MTKNRAERSETEFTAPHLGKEEAASSSERVFIGFFMFTEIIGFKLMNGDTRKRLTRCETKFCDFVK